MMKTRTDRSLLIASVVTAMLSGVSCPALAQDAPVQTPAEASPTDGEIVVTAQRREERLQDVPISITAVGSEELAARGVSDLQALGSTVPGLFISGSSASNGTNTLSIRGISGQPLPIGASQATAIYLDGVYLSRPDAGFFTLDDVERIEVLRGPQGTLYGRNATAGAINIVTRDPGETFAGGVDVSYGNYNAIVAKGSLSGPLGGGFSAGISGSYSRHDDYFFNSVTNRRLRDYEAFTVRGKLRYASPDEMFTAVLSADTAGVNTVPQLQNPYSLVTGAFLGLGDPYVIESDAASAARAKTRVRSKGASISLNWAASDNIDLTWITSYREFANLTLTDLDGTALPALLSQADNRVNTLNSEFRALLTFDRFRLTAGTNYYNEDQYFGFGSGPGTLPGNTLSPVDRSKLEAIALFGQAEFDLTDQLTLVGGLRLNKESRRYSNDYRFAGGRFLVGDISDTVLIPSAGVNFKVTPDILLYAKFSRGYQAPGFNMTPGVTAIATNEFGAETLDSYEIGAKTQFLDRRVTLNLSAFHYDYRDIQVRSTTGPGLVVVSNAASAKIDGVEATLSARLFDGLTLAGNITYLDTRYGSFCELIQPGAPLFNDPLCSPGLADRSGNRLNQAPEWQGGVSLSYAGDVGDAGRLSANVSYNGVSNAYFTTPNEPVISTGKVTKVDARIGFEIAGGPEVYVFGKNLTKDYYRDSVLRGSPALAPTHVSDPRTYGVGIRYRF